MMSLSSGLNEQSVVAKRLTSPSAECTIFLVFLMSQSLSVLSVERDAMYLSETLVTK